MSVQDQILPASSITKEVSNADGSVTRTSIQKYHDGSETITREILSISLAADTTINSSTSIGPVDTTTTIDDSGSSRDNKQSIISSAPIEPRNILHIASIILYGFATIQGFMVLGFLHGRLLSSFSDFLLAVSISILLHVIAVPLMYCAASLYMNNRQSLGYKSFMVTSWILFCFSIVAIINYSIGVFMFLEWGIMWTYSLLILLDLPWIFMMIHAEAARKQDTTMLVARGKNE